MKPEIVEHLRQLDAVETRAERFLFELDEDALNWSPGAGRWSVAQCLEHLSRTANLYAANIEEALETAPPADGSPAKPVRGWFARFFVWYLEPPYRTKAKTKPQFEGPPRMSPEEAARSYRESHRRLRELIERSDAVDIGRVKAVSPFVERLSFRLGECYAILLAHERRHLWQADQVRAAIPSSAG